MLKATVNPGRDNPFGDFLEKKMKQMRNQDRSAEDAKRNALLVALMVQYPRHR